MKIPTYDQMMNPLIQALRELGGSGSVSEIYEETIKILDLPDEILEIPHENKEGSMSEVAYRLAWTRTYLRKYGILENSARGIWAFTPTGQDVREVDPSDVVKKVRELIAKEKITKGGGKKEIVSEDDSVDETEDIEDWRIKLQNILVNMKPDAFERLVQRLLRESGFIQVEVTGRSGDGGIDGKGIYRIKLGVKTEIIKVESVTIDNDWFLRI
ncbi:MAG: hypothetical protein C4554_07130 [Dethiobacter sp.]|jgi:restriction system protein|nr:MAG: hypothetical protein C4554_07130 [Dethiobacter sp.]